MAAAHLVAYKLGGELPLFLFEHNLAQGRVDVLQAVLDELVTDAPAVFAQIGRTALVYPCDETPEAFLPLYALQLPKEHLLHLLAIVASIDAN
jgi:hypothetical protein